MVMVVVVVMVVVGQFDLIGRQWMALLTNWFLSLFVVY